MKLKQRVLESPSGSNHDDLSEAESQHSEFEGEDAPRRMPRREWHPTSNCNDFRVDISKFEGKLYLDEFLEWPHTVERILEYKEVLEDKKVKLVAPRLRKYGGPIFVPRGQETANTKSKHGRIRKLSAKSDFYLLLMSMMATHNFITLLKVI